MTARCSRTRVTTATFIPFAIAARAIGRKCEAKNQSSVTMKTSRVGTAVVGRSVTG